jgi:hypothetical protein
MYRYNAPSMSQYESFFNPIPIDFLQQELGKRQGRYDAAYAGSLAAQDELSNVQVGMADLASKNEIISQGIGDINKLVEDKYGGDWGRASKEVARNVSSLRANPFWNAQAEAQKQREIAQELKIKYGPDAMVFNDPTALSVMNVAGGVRGFDQFQPDIIQRGDWLGTARELLSGLTANELPTGLTQADIKGFLQSGQISEIKRKKIEGLAEDPAIQRAFLNEHPEFRRGFEEGTEGLKQQFGLEGEDISSLVRDQLLGAGASAEFRKETRRYMDDPFALARLKSSLEGGPGYIPSTSETTVINHGQQAVKDHEKRVKASTYQGDVKDLPLTPEEEAELEAISKQYDDPQFVDTETGRNLTKQTAVQSYMDDRNVDRIQGQLDTYHQELVSQHPELEGMSRDEAFTAYGNHLERISQEARTVKTIVRDDSPAEIKKNMLSNIRAGNFESFSFVSTGDVFGRNSVTDELGFNNYDEMADYIKDKDISPRIDFVQGKLLLNLPRKKGKNKYEPVDVYFNPDYETQTALDAGQMITEMYTNAQSYGEDTKGIRLPDARGGMSDDIIFVEGTGNIVDGNDKRIWVVDARNPNAPPRQTSLEAVQNRLTEYIDTKYNNLAGKEGNPGKE